jgi:hypothetical protein
MCTVNAFKFLQNETFLISCYVIVNSIVFAVAHKQLIFLIRVGDPRVGEHDGALGRSYLYASYNPTSENENY